MTLYPIGRRGFRRRRNEIVPTSPESSPVAESGPVLVPAAVPRVRHNRAPLVVTLTEVNPLEYGGGIGLEALDADGHRVVVTATTDVVAYLAAELEAVQRRGWFKRLLGLQTDGYHLVDGYDLPEIAKKAA